MPEKLPPDTSKFLLCPMPGLVVRIDVGEGDEVQEGQALATVEAMKMENILQGRTPGRGQGINAGAGRQPQGRRRDHGVRVTAATVAPTAASLQHLLPAQREAVDGVGDLAHVQRLGLAELRPRRPCPSAPARSPRGRSRWRTARAGRGVGIGDHDHVAVVQRGRDRGSIQLASGGGSCGSFGAVGKDHDRAARPRGTGRSSDRPSTVRRRGAAGLAGVRAGLRCCPAPGQRSGRHDDDRARM